MNTQQPREQDESFALETYAALPRTQPPDAVDARILAAAHAANAVRRPRRWAGGLATAAVAVLAVGVAWRGLETRETSSAPAADQYVLPKLQPAFKVESAIGADRAQAADEAARPETSARENTGSPAFSSADWEAPAESDEIPAPAPESRPPPAPASPYTQIFDQPLPMAEPAAPPSPPQADFAAAVMPEPLPQEIAAKAPATTATQGAADASLEPEVRSKVIARQALPRSVDPAASGDLAEGRAENKDDSRAGAGVAAPAGTTRSTPFPAVEERRKREQGLAPGSKSVPPAQRGVTEATATAQSIRAGMTPYDEAVSAARAAHARGDIDSARSLAAAITARFGSRKLPEDLQTLE